MFNESDLLSFIDFLNKHTINVARVRLNNITYASRTLSTSCGSRDVAGQ